MDISALKSVWRKHLRQQAGQKDAKPAADIRIGLTSSFTVDPLTPYLGAQLLEYGFSIPEISIADYNQVPQSCLSPETAFRGMQPDVMVIAWRLEDLSSSTDIDTLRSAFNLIFNGLRSLTANFSGMVVMCMPPRPQLPSTGLINFSKPDPEAILWYEATSLLISEFNGHDKVHFIDLESIRADLGAEASDERKKYLYRQPYAEKFFAYFGQMAARVIRGRTYEPKKCLVLDCDNTLWGGVVGEDGVGGIQIGEDFPGLAFRRFQQQIKALADSGVFIALNSKNNPDDVWEVFDEHDGMVLKREDISTAQINWKPKSENLKDIASTLNIGLNALVFVDDNPFEISEVETHAPDVTCLIVPEELSDLPSLLMQNSHYFDRLVITNDDVERVARMQGEIKRNDLSQELTADDFLAQLELKVFVYEPVESDLARVTQLINKTNQFNCMTRRCTREEVDVFLSKPENKLYCMSVEDKFGEYGLVGIAMLAPNAADTSVYEFENLLMSCRVLGRGVETTLLSHIASRAAAMNAKKLRGRYLPTPKNAMVADLYERHSFVKSENLPDEGSVWELDLPSNLEAPAFVEHIAGRTG